MSTLYNLEPQPTAQVLLETTSGDILLELFAKQTPLATRNFLQLCLDGYFTGTIFHRLVPGFIIQGGDPTGTGEGGEAIYDGGLFEDEFHSRLKFNRRGLLGMANSGRKNDNGSQFFLTLGPTPELEGKNTMFGRVAGDTVYNLMKMGEAELAEAGAERPLYPTRITKSEVLVNPYDGMVSRAGKVKGAIGGEKKKERAKGKKKIGKALLSFGLEDGEDEAPTQVKEKFNTKLINAESGTKTDTATNGHKATVRKGPEKNTRRKLSRSSSPPPISKPDPELQLPLPDNEKPSRSSSSSPEPPPVVEKVSTLLERTNAQIAEMKASMKRNVPAAPKVEVRKKSALEQMIPENATRGRKRKQGVNGDAPRDMHTLDVLNAFRTKLEKAPQESEVIHTPALEVDTMDEQMHDNNQQSLGPDDEEAELCDLHFIAHCQSCQSWDKQAAQNAAAEDEVGQGWMSHTLSFEKDRLGKDLTWKRKNEEELVVIDPREKSKDIMEEHRAKKVARGGGNLGRAWDRDRDKGRLPVKRAEEKG